ncbi:uncharacterized protein [Lepeophtheirus salmonis]|uniref:uncharacterized protein n=1 Tax=Lepeophtheirus salmonis TaxID=72036 RepID=UPI001AE3A0A1|nr:uncharacterized protein LOC121121729 [Lepeophtheirus salmonis]
MTEQEEEEEKRKRSSCRSFEGFITRKTLLQLVLILVVTHRLIPLVSSSCIRDSHCPHQQICIHSEQQRHIKSGYCRCKEGFVSWKWQCYSSGKSLGQPCRISSQCNGHKYLICDPLTKTCACEIIKLRSGSIWIRRKDCNPPHITKRNMYHNISSNLTTDGGTEDTSFTSSGLSDYQMNTMLYIGLSLSVVILLGLLSLAYRKMIQDKKQSQAAIKGLLELISENQSLNSFCSTISDDEVVIVRSDGQNSSIGGGVGRGGCMGSHPYSISDKLHLSPLAGGDQYPQFPSPHLSTPILPPIRRPSGPPSIASFPPPSF